MAAWLKWIKDWVIDYWVAIVYVLALAVMITLFWGMWIMGLVK